MPRINYGIPYKGSKNMIAEWVVSHVPECDTFIDVFAGGCAIGDCVLRKGRAKHVIANDIDPMPLKCFGMALKGEFSNESRWNSRDEFITLRDTDPYVRYCYSFGNNAKNYSYNQTIEPYKRAVHYVLVRDHWDDFDRLCPEVCDACRAALNGVNDLRERRILLQRTFTNRVKELSGDDWLAPIVQNNPLYRSVKTKKPKRGLADHEDSNIQSFECCRDLELLERLQSLEREVPSLETTSLDYRALTERILATDGAVVYCDPPYRGTSGYGVDFDQDAFLAWALEIGREHPILISEYSIGHDGFIEVDSKLKQSSYSSTTTNIVTERLYTVKGGRYAKEET